MCTCEGVGMCQASHQQEILMKITFTNINTNNLETGTECDQLQLDTCAKAKQKLKLQSVKRLHQPTRVGVWNHFTFKEFPPKMWRIAANWLEGALAQSRVNCGRSKEAAEAQHPMLAAKAVSKSISASANRPSSSLALKWNLHALKNAQTCNNNNM